MIKLSVNINKIAVIRNSRGGNLPDLIFAAKNCEKYGANGITVHPRPDERHIRYRDVYDLKPIITTEFNIEGYPSEKFLNMVMDVKPTQVTLVPDPPDAITSNAGWDTVKHHKYLTEVIKNLKSLGIRVSIFVDPSEKMVEYASYTSTDRIELYTEYYAKYYPLNKKKAIENYIKTANTAVNCGLGINAGHDLNLDNLKFFAENIPNLMEVSIGHALISDALYLGLEKTIKSYIKRLIIKN